MSVFARVLVIGFSCIAVEAFASPESEALVRRGLAEFEAQRYRDAIHFFGEAVKADPKDLHAVFLRAATLNRMGNHREAYVVIRGMESQGAKHPEMDFEAGWALMGMGRARACVDRLERFEKARPGRGQTSEFLGRCYLQLRELDRAETHLRRAVEREPKLKPSVDLSLARLAQARGQSQAARERLQDAAAANAPTGRALRNVLGLPEPVFQPDKPLRLSASLSGGHNDNVIGLGNTIPLPGDISRTSAYFWRANLGAAFTRALTPRTSGVLGYAFLLERYNGLSVANLNDHFLHGDLQHLADERTAASLRLSHQHTRISDSSFRDQSALRGALARRFTDNSATELAYTYSLADYHTPVTAAPLDRSGYASEFSLAHQFRVPRTPWSGGAGLTHARNRATGGDFDFNADTLSGFLRYEFVPRVSGALGASFARHDYSNLNSNAGAGFAFARRDNVTAYSVQLSGPLDDTLRWFLQAQVLRNGSNIPFYDFKQNVISGGIAANF